MNRNQIPAPGSDELLTTAKSPWFAAGFNYSVTGQHGEVAYNTFTGRLSLIDPNGFEIDAMGSSWKEQVAEAVDADDDRAVFELLAGHYRTELAKVGAR
jgi:hypothetical protein